MWVYDSKRICSICGAKDTAFFAQPQRRTQFTISNMCYECKAVERSKYYYTKDKYKRYLNHKDNMYAQEVL